MQKQQDDDDVWSKAKSPLTPRHVVGRAGDTFMHDETVLKVSIKTVLDILGVLLANRNIFA